MQLLNHYLSYRDFNRGGLQNYINTFDTGRPPDFQAAFYVYNMLQKIFKNIGYKIDSSFINSDHFKRLITTFPFLKNDAKDNRVHFSCTQQRQSGDWQSVHDNVGLGTLNTWHTCILNHNVKQKVTLSSKFFFFLQCFTLGQKICTLLLQYCHLQSNFVQ